MELEDLSCPLNRATKPALPRKLAKLLDEKRLKSGKLHQNGWWLRWSPRLGQRRIKGRCCPGRVKQSISNLGAKCARKGIDFSQGGNERARVAVYLVPEVRELFTPCFGVVHGLWRHIPKRFDDYKSD